ncbi:MAG: hypothetical protein AB8F74_01295 [Saprospiraceae bacterium]
MSDLENLYNKRFKDKELPNDDFDVDGLWDAVAEDLDQKEDDKPKASSFRKFGLIAIGLLLALGLSYFSFENEEELVKNLTITENDQTALENKDLKTATSENTEQLGFSGNNNIGEQNAKSSADTKEESNNATTSSEKNLIQENKDITTIENKKSKSEITNTNTQNFIKSNTKREDNTTKKAKTNTKNQTATPIAEENTKPELLNKALAETDKSTTTNVDPKIDETKLPTEDAKLDNNASTSSVTASQKEENTKDENPTVVPSSSDSKSIIEKAESTNWASLALKTTDFQFQNKKADEGKRATKPLKNKPLQLTVEAFGGLNRMNADYTSLSEATVSVKEEGSTGYSFGVKAGLLWNKQWSLKTGLEYHELWSRFEYEDITQRDSFMNDVLVQVVTDPTTNTVVNRRFADTLVTQTDTRSVIHNNKYTLYSIPLELGWQAARGRFAYGLSAGLSFNFLKMQEGKRLDADGLITSISERTNTTAFKDFSLGFRITPMVGYHLTKSVSLTVSPQWEWSRVGRASQVGNGVGRLGVNVGLGFRF